MLEDVFPKESVHKLGRQQKTAVKRREIVQVYIVRSVRAGGSRDPRGGVRRVRPHGAQPARGQPAGPHLAAALPQGGTQGEG